MTAVFSPDVAPDLSPGVVRWQRRPAAVDRRELERDAVAAAGVVAVVLLAVGMGAAIAYAAGKIASGRASGPKTSLRRRLRRPF